MKEKIKILKEKWKKDRPNDELSILIGKNEAVYVGRFTEGIVLRLNDDEDQVTFLTGDMAQVLGERLLSGNIPRG